MAYQILSMGWVGEFDPDEWLPCLKNAAETLEKALIELCTLIEGDIKCSVSYPYRVVEVDNG
jgi:hypothetical protein